MTLAFCAGTFSVPAAAQTVFNATPSTLGQIPDSVGECVGADGAPLLVAVPASGMVGGLTSVSVSLTLSHTWMGEVSARLISPDGTTFVVFGRTLATGPPGWGSAADLNGTYVFNDAAPGNLWTVAAGTGQTEVVTPGAYRTSEIGNGTPSSTGAITAINPAFNNREANGIWFLRFNDSCKDDIGTVTAASLTLATNGIITPPIAAVNDDYIAGRNTPLVVAAPGVLANDVNSAGSGALSATLLAPPSHGTVTVNGNGGFTYTPTANYLGADAFTYIASNNGGNAPAPATVNITVVPIQPPTNFQVERVVGNEVTLRWNPPAVGPAATSYLLEGGVTPGGVLASIPLANVPIVTFTAPTGAFFVRVKALDGAMVSGNSNEVPLYVNVAVPPSAPSRLTGLVNGDSVALAWKLTYGGGAPSNVILDVSGALSASLPVGLGESFNFAGVPAGTYTFALRGSNAAGVSAASAPVTLTFPGACSGVPQPPQNYIFYRQGGTVYLVWDPPAAGAAPTSYTLNVSGSFVGALPVGPNRVLSTPVPPGTYTVSVTAFNACGASTTTAPQTVVVP